MMKRNRVSYTADFKLNAVEKANEVGNREAARFFNVDKSNIRLWRRNKTNFENCDRRKRADRRGKPHWPELEAEINKWILKERDDGKAVSMFSLAAPAREDCVLLLAACHNGHSDRTLSAAVLPWRPEENLKHTKKNGTDKDYTTNI
ncbi:uncharacterized protein TNCV_595871 [Trichonephila clavipes]|uniref:Brinker DNA-binding domain-containing protein n=1 Tax=Trichonephila clavipes TaxID=2585209 RepID=A0A8X6UTM5_TRICX|nr:uncharacterized protein TNCV_595871 [Trichonephila clavipes]